MAPDQDATLQLTLADAESVEAAARAFAANQGVAAGAAARLTINGLSATAVPFRVQLQRGQIAAGRAAFIAHDDAVFQLLAYAPEARWPAFRDEVERSVRSFEPLTDPAALAVEPWHIELVELERDLTLEEFVERYPSPASPEFIGLVKRDRARHDARGRAAGQARGRRIAAEAAKSPGHRLRVATALAMHGSWVKGSASQEASPPDRYPLGRSPRPGRGTLPPLRR